jgi:hypothetical protein
MEHCNLSRPSVFSWIEITDDQESSKRVANDSEDLSNVGDGNWMEAI